MFSVLTRHMVSLGHNELMFHCLGPLYSTQTNKDALQVWSTRVMAIVVWSYHMIKTYVTSMNAQCGYQAMNFLWRPCRTEFATALRHHRDKTNPRISICQQMISISSWWSHENHIAVVSLIISNSIRLSVSTINMPRMYNKSIATRLCQ